MADKIRLNGPSAARQTAVSNIFIDSYMPVANGEYVKIYLYLQRCIQHSCEVSSLTDIADLFDHTENDVLRALKYWERQKLLTLDFDASGVLTGISMQEPIVPEAPASAIALSGNTAAAGNDMNIRTTDPAGRKSSAGTDVPTRTNASPAKEASYIGQKTAASVVPSSGPTPRRYTPEEMDAFGSNEELQELFFIIQTYINHPLSETDTNLILFWYDELAFSAELVEYLVEYCITKGHYSTSYMNRVALGWAKDNITTVTEARDNVQKHSQAYYSVMKALGIHGRSLVPAEMDFLRKWTKEYGFSQELIEEACARTITATHQSSFEYTDSILTRWHNENVRTMQDVQKADALYAQQKKAQAAEGRPAAARPTTNKFNNFSQRTYDESELEKRLLAASMGDVPAEP